MTGIVPLNNVDHADLLVDPRSGAAFGDAVNQVAVFPPEFEAAARHFPIFLRRVDDGYQAIALLGLDRDENLFLDGDRWTSRYTPAMRRRGPFLIGVPEDGAPGEPTVQVDTDDARVGVANGQRVFLPHGGNAPYLDYVAAALRTIHDGQAAAQALYATWTDAGLLEPITLDIELDERSRYHVPDLLTIGEAKLAALPGEMLARLNAAGQLRPAFVLLAATANVNELIARKNRRRAAAGA